MSQVQDSETAQGDSKMNIVEYFKFITKLEPIPEQVELLNSLVDIIIKNLAVSAGRGFSKTLCSALAVLYFADVYADEVGHPLEILLVASQNRMYFHLNNFFHDNKEYLDAKLKQKGKFDEIPEVGFELLNGSIVNVAMPTNKSIRSNRADIVIIDEAAQVPTSIIKAASGCLTRDICKLVLISTPHMSGYFTDIVDKPELFNFTLKVWNSEVCPWQKTANERLKDTMTVAEYAAEVKGQVPTKAERSFFPAAQVEACYLDVEPIREGGAKSTVEAGIDWGGSSPTCVTITEKLSVTKRKVLACKCWSGMIEQNLDEMAKLILEWKPTIIKADNKPKEYQGKLEPHIHGYKITYIDMAVHKQPMLGQLQKRIRHTQMVISRCFFDLKKELLSYRFMTKDELGLSGYKGNKQDKDDRVDSLALSCYEPIVPLQTRKGSGLVKC